jgi:hypothetical protein
MTVSGSVAVMARETNLKLLAQISWWNPLLISPARFSR